MNRAETILLLTRPRPAAERFRAQVERALGHFGSVVLSPLLEIAALPFEPLPLDDEELAFTSENGVAALLARQSAAGRRAWCVGARTAACAREAGFDVEQAKGTVRDLAALVLSSGSRAPLVHVAGRHRRGDLAATLCAAGRPARTVDAYEQRACPLSREAVERLSGEREIIAPLFSPRTARLLAEASSERRARVTAIAISTEVAASWQAKPGERQEIAQTPDAEGVISAMGRLFDADPSA